MQEKHIPILASDSLSDNLWDADILDEVVRFRRFFMGSAPDSPSPAPGPPNARGTLASMPSEVPYAHETRLGDPHCAKVTPLALPHAESRRAHGNLGSAEPKP